MKWMDSLNENLEHGAEWVGKNFGAVAGVLAVAIVVGGVWAAVSYSKENKGNKALTAYAPLEREYIKWKTPENPQGQEQAKKEASKVDPQNLFSELLKFMNEQGNVPASQLAALMASDVAATLGAAQEKELLVSVDKNLGTGSKLMDGLTLLKKGDLQANQDQCDEAVKTWNQVISTAKLGFLHDVARLKTGLCFEKLSKFTEAEGQYDHVIKGPSVKTEAERNAESLRQKHWAVKEAHKLKRALKWSQKSS